jgi:poly(ADP-ribose) glycohydrolase ARH3
MADVARPLEDRFRGCLLGLAVGDALGGLFEGQDAEAIRSRCPTVEALVAYPREGLWYTDDTQMTIGVAEALAADGEIVEGRLCRAFAANYVPSRGYGRGARAVIEAMERSENHVEVAERYFPGGSFGNGAAMRVAPVGLIFRDDPPSLREQAMFSAFPTHRHPLGIEGAVLLATAVAQVSRADRFDRGAFFDEVLSSCESAEFRLKIEEAARVDSPSDLARLGNGITATESVATAIASFALAPESFAESIGRLILLGGDTDTMAAMAGAISGAYLGLAGLPPRLVGLLEDGHQGRSHLMALADRLAEAYLRRIGVGRPS